MKDTTFTNISLIATQLCYGHATNFASLQCITILSQIYKANSFLAVNIDHIIRVICYKSTRSGISGNSGMIRHSGLASLEHQIGLLGIPQIKCLKTNTMITRVFIRSSNCLLLSHAVQCT